MDDKPLQDVRVAILLTDGFEQVEMEAPRKALIAAGATTVLVSPKDGTVQGMNHDQKGDTFPVDLSMSEANPSEFDAALLPGGVVNADALRMNQQAQHFVQSLDNSSKPIAVICHGPWLLVSSGLVNGRNLTSYYTLQDDIRNAGGNWSDEEVVADRNWVSSRKPDDIPSFNRAMVELFQNKHKATRTATASGSILI